MAVCPAVVAVLTVREIPTNDARSRPGISNSEQAVMSAQPQTVYQKHGYSCRHEYFEHLADTNEVDISTINQLAYLLGPNEDFDGLVVALEDYSNGF